MPDYTENRTMMVDTQIRPSDVTKFPIIDAMLSVQRENFVPQQSRNTAYADCAIDLGNGRSMLEPRVLAKMLDALDIQPNEFVLSIGAGSGYSAAIVSRMAEAVVALEQDETLASDAEAQLSEANADNVAVVSGTMSDGAANHGPFDVILFDGAIEMLPAAISSQLKDGGRIAAIFREGALGTCRVGYKSGEAITWRDAFNANADILPGFNREIAFAL